MGQQKECYVPLQPFPGLCQPVAVKLLPQHLGEAMLSGNKQRVEITLVKEQTLSNLKSFFYPFGVTPIS